MNALNGLDGKSVLIGGGLVLAGIVVTKGGLFPILFVGGIVYFIGSKKGWWGQQHFGPGHQPGTGSHLAQRRPGGGPPFFAEWHRQAHAADAAPGYGAGYGPGYGVPAAPQAPTWQPQGNGQEQPAASAPTQDIEVRVPVTAAPASPVSPAQAPTDGSVNPAPPAPEPEYRRTVGQDGESFA